MNESINEDKIIESDHEKKDDIEILQSARLIIGSKAEERIWDVIDKTSIGRYVTPYKVILEGEYRDGMFHGNGSVYWPRKQRMDGIWNRGKMEQKRYTFADGLSYQEDEWNYCKFPDRRFYNCIVHGLRPAGKVLKTNNQPTKIIPPYHYDTSIGIFDPDTNCITSYRNCKKIIKIPTTAENVWIKENCRRGWSEPTGHQAWIDEYWQSGAADFATLPGISPNDMTENWWRRFDIII